VPFLELSLYRLVLYVSTPIMLVKALISLIHLIDASGRLASIDADERNKSTWDLPERGCVIYSETSLHCLPCWRCYVLICRVDHLSVADCTWSVTEDHYPLCYASCHHREGIISRCVFKSSPTLDFWPKLIFRYLRLPIILHLNISVSGIRNLNGLRFLGFEIFITYCFLTIFRVLIP